MPQKKNPDAAELLRAKAPRVVGHLAALHGVMHALPLTYNKDLQEDKEHLFDAVDTLELTLAAATGMIAGVSFDRERMSEAAADELIAATDVADLLVRLGVPVPRGPRRRRGPRAHGARRREAAVRADARGARGAQRDAGGARATSSARCSRRARGSSPRSPRAARHSRACVSSSSWPGRRSMTRVAEALPAGFYDRPVVEVARDLIGCIVELAGAAG